jgi:hypothetical protein
VTASVPASPAQPIQYVVAAGPQFKNGIGTAALVCGIIGVVFGLVPIMFYLSFPLGVLGVVFGAIGMSRAKRNIANNRGSAVAGFVTGIIALAFAIFSVAVIYSAVNQVNNDLNRIYSDTSSNSARFQLDQRRADQQEHLLIHQGAFIGNDF